MRQKLLSAVGLAALTVMMTSSVALAQRGGGGGGGSMGGTMQQGAQMPRGDVDQMRDRMRDQDRVRDQDQIRDQDQDRDRLRTSQVVDDQLTSLNLLSNVERERFRNQMRSATTADERNRIRAEHQNIIQERARELGMQARGGYMLMQVLNEQERAQFFNRLRTAQTEQERQQIRNEMHVMARQRAQEMGVDVPEWYGMGSGAN